MYLLINSNGHNLKEAIQELLAQILHALRVLRGLKKSRSYISEEPQIAPLRKNE